MNVIIISSDLNNNNNINNSSTLKLGFKTNVPSFLETYLTLEPPNDLLKIC